MVQTEQWKVCFACGTRFNSLKEGRHIVAATRVVYFCPKHRSKNFHALEKALRKYHEQIGNGLPRVPLEICEYKLLIEAGVI